MQPMRATTVRGVYARKRGPTEGAAGISEGSEEAREWRKKVGVH